MVDQKHMEKVNRINALPINIAARELMAAQKEPVLSHWIHALQATQLAVEKNLIRIDNPQLKQAVYEIVGRDPLQIAEILGLENLSPEQDLAEIALQVLNSLDLYLTENVQGYPNLQG